MTRDELGWEMIGSDATSRSQCPFPPGSREWRLWQHEFMNEELWRDNERGVNEAAARMAAAGLARPVWGGGKVDVEWKRTMCRPEPTRAQAALNALLDEVENGPMVEVSGAGYTASRGIISSGPGFIRSLSGGPAVPFTSMRVTTLPVVRPQLIGPYLSSVAGTGLRDVTVALQQAYDATTRLITAFLPVVAAVQQDEVRKRTINQVLGRAGRRPPGKPKRRTR